MTTFVPFQPNSAFTFNLTVDGNLWTGTVTWNLWGYGAGGIAKRPYLTLFDQNANRVLTTAMVGSPLGYDINLLVPGLGFSTSIVYRPETGNIEVS